MAPAPAATMVKDAPRSWTTRPSCTVVLSTKVARGAAKTLPDRIAAIVAISDEQLNVPSSFRSVHVQGIRTWRICHPEHSEGSKCRPWIPRFARDDSTGTPETAEDCGRLRKVIEPAPSVCN